MEFDANLIGPFTLHQASVKSKDRMCFEKFRTHF